LRPVSTTVRVNTLAYSLKRMMKLVGNEALIEAMKG